MNFHPLPFYDERRTQIDLLLYHCSAQHTDEMLANLQSNQLSCHYIIDTDGHITQVVPEDKRAWHAGLGSWREIKEDVNSHAIGIELTSLSMGQEPYSQSQIETLITLSKEIIHRYQIKPQNIIGHSDSAPIRKPDPGKSFPWQYLAQNGIGLWYDLKDAADAPTQDVRKLLSDIGYDTRDDLTFKATQYAFARHFIPQLVQNVDDIGFLLDNVFPPETDFRTDERFITTAQAVYMRFKLDY